MGEAAATTGDDAELLINTNFKNVKTKDHSSYVEPEIKGQGVGSMYSKRSGKSGAARSKGYSGYKYRDRVPGDADSEI